MIAAEYLHGPADRLGCAGSGSGGSLGMISFGGTGSDWPSAMSPIALIASTPAAMLLTRRLMLRSFVVPRLPMRADGVSKTREGRSGGAHALTRAKAVAQR
jgi:hypothetical protein